MFNYNPITMAYSFNDNGTIRYFFQLDNLIKAYGSL